MAAPPALTHPTIQVRQTWNHGWETDATLRVVGPVAATIGGAGAGVLRLVRRYGKKVKYRADSSWTTNAAPVSYMDYWVRLLASDGTTVLWQGTIKQDQRKVMPSDGVQQGEQRLVAYGPKEILRRCEISTSYYQVSGQPVQDLGHLLPMNRPGPRGELEGNKGIWVLRSYLFGDTGALWSHYTFLQYIIKEFVQQYTVGGNPTGPQWDISTPADLDQLATMLRFGASTNALDVVRRLVRPDHGHDFVVLPTALGFDIKVFALLKDPVTFGSATVAGNSATLTVSPTTEAGVVHCEAELDGRQKVDRLETIGERIETALPLSPSNHEPMWTSAQETAYKAGTGTPADDGSKHDTARSADAHRLTYQGLRAITNIEALYSFYSPELNALGAVTGTGADGQTTFRETLAELPLKEGGDYSTSPPTLVDGVEDYRPTLAMVNLPSSLGYIPVDKLSAARLETQGILAGSMAVRTLAREWGVIIEADPNHALARNHWAAGSPAASAKMPDPDTEGIDYDAVQLLIGIRTDQRLKCYADRPTQTNDGSKKVIEVPGAKLQYLPAQTPYDAKPDGTLKYSAIVNLTLRNDQARLQAIMAGAYQQYLADRFRVVIVWNEIKTYLSKLGSILIMGSGEGDLTGKWGLITSVEYDFERGRTTVRAGYSRK